MILNDIDLKLLKLFKTVAEAGGFTQAAVVLNVGTSTISTHMADLEKRLGFKLCERGRSGFALTDEGRKTLDLALKLFRQIDDCASEISAIQGRMTGSLNIGQIDYMTSVPEFKIAQVMHEFTNNAPEVILNLQVLPEAEVIRGILNGHLHLGIGPSLPARGGLIYEPFLEETLQVYCSPSHPLCIENDGNVTLQQIHEYRFIGKRLAAKEDGLEKWMRQGDAHGSNLETIAILILSGDYLGVLPTHFAQQWIDSGEMVAVRPDLTAVRQELMLVTRNGVPHAPLKEFLRLLKQLANVNRF